MPVVAALERADVALLRFMRTHGHRPLLERAVIRFSRLGEHSAIWLLTGGAGAVIDRERRKVYVRAVRTVAAAEVTNAVAKLLVGRRRPAFEDLPPLAATMSSRSHPSAHATSSFAAARVLSEALPAGLVYAIATAMALSRPYLGVHYPSDVLAGMLLGTVVAELTAGQLLGRGTKKSLIPLES